MDVEKSNVVSLVPAGSVTNSLSDVDGMLEKAKGEYAEAIIMGYDHDGALVVRSSGLVKAQDILFITQLFQHKLMNGDYADPNE